MVVPSLFDAPPEPVIASSADWVGHTLLGNVAIGLCVIAVAFVGLMLMSGHLAVREAMRVCLGCFILFGAPTIASSLFGGPNPQAQMTVEAPIMADPVPSPQLPPAHYDPYAGASLRTE